MNTENDWEEMCRKEVEARDKKTEIFGVLSDRNLRGYMTNHAILASIDGKNGNENWSKILDASLYADKIRGLIGLSQPVYSDEDIPATLSLKTVHP